MKVVEKNYITRDNPPGVPLTVMYSAEIETIAAVELADKIDPRKYTNQKN